MKIISAAVFFLAALAALAWLLWPSLSPHVERAKDQELVKVRKLNPFQ